jgi:hypothetical protein
MTQSDGGAWLEQRGPDGLFEGVREYSDGQLAAL